MSEDERANWKVVVGSLFVRLEASMASFTVFTRALPAANTRLQVRLVLSDKPGDRLELIAVAHLATVVVALR